MLHTLLRQPDLREQAAQALAGYGWTVIAPKDEGQQGFPLTSVAV